MVDDEALERGRGKGLMLRPLRWRLFYMLLLLLLALDLLALLVMRRSGTQMGSARWVCAGTSTCPQPAASGPHQ